jgi:hypothetical protein
MARDRRRVAAVLCKRLQGLLEALAVLVNTIMAMPVIVDHQVGTAWQVVVALLLVAIRHTERQTCLIVDHKVGMCSLAS